MSRAGDMKEITDPYIPEESGTNLYTPQEASAVYYLVNRPVLGKGLFVCGIDIIITRAP